MKKRLYDLGINLSVLDAYDEPHRFYHNMEHIDKLIADAGVFLTDDLLVAIVFHDIVYDPKRTDNEEKSVEVLRECAKNRRFSHKINVDLVCEAIMDTANSQFYLGKNDISNKLWTLDTSITRTDDISEFIEYEHKIFKEYQFVDYKMYKHKRVELLEKYGVKKEFIDYVKHRKVNIGLYCGSFSPMSTGHYNVIQKAEKIFDKVIVARGINPEKVVLEQQNFLLSAVQPARESFPAALKYHQTELYKGLLTDFVDGLGYDVTLIRGLRNQSDILYELNQLRFMQDLKPDIKVVSIFCDKEFEHVSSSAIRNLQKYGKGDNYILK